MRTVSWLDIRTIGNIYSLQVVEYIPGSVVSDEHMKLVIKIMLLIFWHFVEKFVSICCEKNIHINYQQMWCWCVQKLALVSLALVYPVSPFIHIFKVDLLSRNSMHMNCV